nr:hybrid signal transduction histidine kinase M [Tanacetum cinerariifolium]
SLGLKTHIEGSSTNSNDPEWDKQDNLVKVWILITLEESLQDQVVTTPGNAKALWDHIKDLFHDNKDARAITLDGEVRSIKLGSLAINAYCTKIKAMANRLANLGEKVSDKNLVMYALNGLDTRYKGIARLIHHSQPLPKFETARNMLLLEESNLQEATDQANTYDSSSSSLTVLMETKTNTKGTHTETQPLPQICNHFNKGSCKFGDRLVKPATICTVLSLAVSRKWPIHQLDVKNAFLNRDLSETVNMHQPPGFVDPRYPHHVCLLQKSLYGLKQAPRAWFQRFAGYATRTEFYHSRCDSSLFILRQGSQVAYLLIYVDDIILTASSTYLLHAEAEYRGVANVVAETAWLRNLLRDLHSLLSAATFYADIFTKGLQSALFEDFRSSLSIRLPPARTVGAY